MPVDTLSKKEFEEMVSSVHDFADKKINEDWQPDKSNWSLYKKAQWWIEERLYNLIGDDPYDRIKEWLIKEPASNGLAIFLALLIIFFD
jgi:hypothetical protein